jgi:hypothetical protein
VGRNGEDAHVISAATFLVIEFLAAAVLALWVLVRFPRLGPTALRPAVLVAFAGLVVLRIASVGVGLVLALPYGVYLALLGCALPGLFAAFLSAAWLLRALASALPGSGGGPGEPVRSRAY